MIFAILVTVLTISLVFFFGPRHITFYISNQSLQDPYVNLTVRTNGVFVASQEFYVANQNNVTEINVLTWGAFQLVTVSDDDHRVDDSETLFAPWGGYIVVMYWNSTDYFTIQYFATRPGFM